MRKIIAPLIFLGLLTSTVDAVQAPTISVTFSCSPAGPACTEFLRLVSDGLGYPGTGSRMTFVQSETLRRLHTIGREQKKLEDGKAAINNAEAAFNTTYPPPE